MRALQQRPSTLDLKEYASQIAFFKKSIPSHLTFPRRSKSIPSRAEREKTKQTKKQPRKKQKENKQTGSSDGTRVPWTKRNQWHDASVEGKLGTPFGRVLFLQFFLGGIYNNNNNKKNTDERFFFLPLLRHGFTKDRHENGNEKREREREKRDHVIGSRFPYSVPLVFVFQFLACLLRYCLYFIFILFFFILQSLRSPRDGLFLFSGLCFFFLPSLKPGNEQKKLGKNSVELDDICLVVLGGDWLLKAMKLCHFSLWTNCKTQ